MTERKFCARCKCARLTGGNVYRGPQAICTRRAPPFPEVNPMETVCGEFEASLVPLSDSAWGKSMFEDKQRRCPTDEDVGKVADMEGEPVRLLAQLSDNWFAYERINRKHSVGSNPQHCFTVELTK